VWIVLALAGASLARADDGSGSAAPSDEPEDASKKPIETWGAIEPGKGFLIGRTELGELYISAYGLVRYMNQMPSGQTYVDHLGTTRATSLRHDIWSHRIMVHLKGWAGVPKLRYQVTAWTVSTTDQVALFATIGYQFHRAFSLYGGLNGLPGSRTLQGSHPYWLGHDRVMADEFFRPYFTHGVWATGEPLPGLWYQAMVGNNLSGLGITSGQLTRDFAYAASLWCTPTTHEFGPNGSFDDWEYHTKLATRFGVSGTTSREDSFDDKISNLPENTTIRLADAVNVFETGALAPGVSVQKLRYRLLSADAGMKYRGVFLQGAYFLRVLEQIKADGRLPVSSVVDQGFYLQAAFYPVKHKLELYGATSWVFGDEDAGFQTQHEYLGGANWFFTTTREVRLNAQLIRVNRSPVSSSFGYYAGGQKGMTAALAVSFNF
jgi:hypothetical protein